jgi:hypothetical protein
MVGYISNCAYYRTFNGGIYSYENSQDLTLNFAMDFYEDP